MIHFDETSSIQFPIKKYDWIFQWYDKDWNLTRLDLADKTIAEAYNEAIFFGWKEPKKIRWWQFWRMLSRKYDNEFYHKIER